MGSVVSVGCGPIARDEWQPAVFRAAAPAGAAGAQALPKRWLLTTEVTLISNSQHIVQGQDPKSFEDKIRCLYAKKKKLQHINTNLLTITNENALKYYYFIVSMYFVF
jgi:hypothetical protein